MRHNKAFKKQQIFECTLFMGTSKGLCELTSEIAPASASLRSSDACAARPASGVQTLGGPPVSDDDFGEGILLTKHGVGTVTALDFFLGAGVGMRVFGVQHLALSSLSSARRPLPGLAPLACRQQPNCEVHSGLQSNPFYLWC